jgi:hypothetical protein
MEKILKLFFISAIIIASSGCKKISTPNDDSKKIFGKWDYQSNTGGFSGAGGSTKYCDDCWIEVTERGRFIIYDGNDKKISKSKFTIKMVESIYDHEHHPAIVYESGWSESYEVNDDALILSEEAYDGFSYVFIKR